MDFCKLTIHAVENKKGELYRVKTHIGKEERESKNQVCRAAGRVGDELVVEDRSARSASAHGAQRDHDEPFSPVIPL